MKENIHENYMRRCFQLAKRALGNTYPNPIVGCVIVHRGKIVGEGYHKKAGEPHAEVNAINSVKNPEILKECDLYVNLEPCAHYGKTPACSKLIIEINFLHVFVGCKDSFSKVSGRGMEMMKKAGIKVKSGILEKESRDLNKRFFTLHEKKRPYIILKWARTIDGFIDFERKPTTPIKPNWITAENARVIVHKWRSEEQSIMIGTNTAAKDNPKLNLRDWEGNQPIRIVLDRNLRLDKKFHVFDNSQKTLIITQLQRENSGNTEYIQMDFDKNFYDNLFRNLFERDIQSVFIEGGAQLLQNLINEGYWDEAREFIGNVKFFKGVCAPVINSEPKVLEEISGSKLYIYKNMNL